MYKSVFEAHPLFKLKWTELCTSCQLVGRIKQVSLSVIPDVPNPSAPLKRRCSHWPEPAGAADVVLGERAEPLGRVVVEGAAREVGRVGAVHGARLGRRVQPALHVRHAQPPAADLVKRERVRERAE